MLIYVAIVITQLPRNVGQFEGFSGGLRTAKKYYDKETIPDMTSSTASE